MSADTALAEALAVLADAGRTWPCRGREDWTCDDAGLLAEAAQACAACPALAACARAALADPPSWGAWAGEVFVPKGHNEGALARLRARHTQEDDE